MLKTPPKQSYTNISILPSLKKWDAGIYCKFTYSVIWCMQSQIFRMNQSSFGLLLLLWICTLKEISVKYWLMFTVGVLWRRIKYFILRQWISSSYFVPDIHRNEQIMLCTNTQIYLKACVNLKQMSVHIYICICVSYVYWTMHHLDSWVKRDQQYNKTSISLYLV